jgi:hypothetical protein
MTQTARLSPLLPLVTTTGPVRRCPWWPACDVITQNGDNGQTGHIATVHRREWPTRTGRKPQ